MIIHRYVVGFVFHSTDPRQVLLIIKRRPKWQEGKLNGVGGKIEDGETPLEAMIRECKEETDIHIEDWKSVCILDDKRVWRVFFYVSKSSQEPKFCTDERPVWADSRDLPSNVLPNLHWLIPMARVASGGCPLHIIELGAAEAAAYELEGDQTDRLVDESLMG